MLKGKKLRVARPSRDLVATEKFYVQGLGLEVLGRFEDHAGIDGIMLGHSGVLYHFEFTRHRHALLEPRPTLEDLVVFYIPDFEEWKVFTEKLSAQGFKPVEPLNPYWNQKGKTYQDPDGYRVVIQNADWG